MTQLGPLAEIDRMITTAWERPMAELEATAAQRPVEDALLRSVMRARQALIHADTTARAHQDRLHALTSPGVIASFDLDRITTSANALRVATAEADMAMRAITYLVDSRELADQAGRVSPGRVQAAVARSVPESLRGVEVNTHSTALPPPTPPHSSPGPPRR
ncbi:hypothetical protein OG783_28825 [Streptomyces jietaisiensis]|uniref:hypothetical protein n=1 Tax=Streptomyces griseoaurantiacus TaxID=68213 RepID=UPI003253A8B2